MGAPRGRGGYDLDAMRRSVAQCDENIKVFQGAIAKEMSTKEEYQEIVRFLEEQAARTPVVQVEQVVLNPNDPDPED